MEPLLLTPKEAAQALGLSQSYVYELLASEALPSITIGRTRRIPRRALEDFVDARAAEQAGYAPHPTGKRYPRAATS
jgi:excisionase family DNA binding protein